MNSFKEIFETRYTWLEGFMRNVRRYSNRTAMIDPQTDSVWTSLSIPAYVPALMVASL